MKKLIVCICLVLCLVGPCCAQKKSLATETIGEWVERLAAEKEAERLKSYYIDRSTADICESWRSCAKWAFEEYEKDQSFKIVKAEVKTQRKVYRHRVIKETHLFVEARYKYRTVRLEFITPKASGRTRSYNYIGQFPK